MVDPKAKNPRYVSVLEMYVITGQAELHPTHLVEPELTVA